jgi:hypothetical protein
MEISNVVTLAVAALLGAAAQELMWWYEIRHEIDAERYRRLIRSGAYWAVVVATMLLSTGGTLFMNWDRLSVVRHSDFLIFGAAFPLIFKQLVGSAGRRMKTSKLGVASELASYFRI